VEIVAAVEQPDDPLRVDLQGRNLLPEPLDPGLVGPGELGVGQLTHEGDHELAELALVGAGSQFRGGVAEDAAGGSAGIRHDLMREGVRDHGMTCLAVGMLRL
jgi:hypothetical protein